MLKKIKKLISLCTLSILLGIIIAPAAFAATCPDQDGDGYITLNSELANAVFEDSGFNPNGNYTAVEWQNFFTNYKQEISGETEECTNIEFKKGAEAIKCDSTMINENSGVYDPTQAESISGSQIYPGAFDKADNGIDENCDGKDSKLIVSAGAEKDLGGLTEKIITYLSRAVALISIAFLIIGGIMYSVAAGDETKTGKAKKAMIGAVIGLIVGLLAPSIVSYIIAGLG